MMRRVPTRRAASVAALAGALATAACRNDAAAPAPPLRPVLTTTVQPTASETFGPFASVVEARYQTQLGFQLAGRMVARDVFVGDTVKKGQRLGALDPTVVQFALLRAKAEVVDATAQLANAEGIEERQRTLATAGNASMAVLDNATAGRDTAKARLDQAQASLRMANDQFGYTELHANFDAVVTAWTAEVGQYVDNGQAVVTLARPDIREAVVDIPDDLLGEIQVGMVFVARLQASPGFSAEAAVREIDPLADSMTRSHRVRLALKNASAAFRLGTTLSVSRERPTTPFVPLPATAIWDAGDKAKDRSSAGPKVWLLDADGHHVHERDVTLATQPPGERDGDVVRVASGLERGDRVVVVGVHSLANGEAVAGEPGPSGPVTKAGSKGL